MASSQQELIDLLKTLIRFKTMHVNPAEIAKCARFIEKYILDLGIPCQYIENKKIPSILTMGTNGNAPVLLMSHMDVVAADDMLFEPVEKDGNLYGRGSLDDKYAIAVSLLLLKSFAQKNKDKIPFGILITGDEEIGGKNGAQIILKNIKTDFCIALDGGKTHEIVIKEKGILRLKMIAKGKAAHASRPWKGENAIENLMEDYRIIKTFFEYSSPDHWHRTMNLGIISGGKVINQVPDLAEAILDIRYTENDNIDEMINAIRQKVKCRIEILEQEPIFISEQSPYLEKLLKMDPNLKTIVEHGASDARYLEENNLKGIVWGSDGGNVHAVDEYVNIDGLFRFYELLYKFLETV